MLILQIIFIQDIYSINSEEKNNENQKNDKILSSSTYDITKGVILGLAISFVTSYMNKEKILSLLDNLTKMIKNKNENEDDDFSE
ncbi:9958_t:CDS:2, partial [Scutellospora calospora]